ncbi:K+ transport system, NAD-binding component [Desulfoscipio gibsoniae DSM 7213]|uniref:Trk system potassium uptake protein TrkA n=1 Tax=Desulfoscipio gibsoniae DSM 7213 TaxID=767817 RepID=R4KND7_9FIRM|nr:Trk system potassium transporter TrkA [Desulfoscipio gibsoniae]AGL03072.1 K+ transport system, NAD-binding component [Desulfoscipio gibsoniae DSM 7213]
MKTTIIGVGKIGKEIAARLWHEGHDLVIIEKNEAKLQKIEEDLDCHCIKGSGATAKTLSNPIVAESELLIAVTNSDEVNMIACMTAKRIGIPRTVARIRDPDYSKNLIISKEDLGIDLIINPDYSAAMEINRFLTMTLPVHMEPFARGRVQLADITVNDSMTIFANKRLMNMDIPGSLLIVAISRNGDMIIPGGRDIVLPGDTIYLLGHSDIINKICSKVKKKRQKVQTVMILGGGRTGFYLAERLCSQGMKVKVIEQNNDRCRELAEKLPEALILCADGSDLELLRREGIKDTDAFVTVTGLDEENLLLALLAKQMGAKRVIAKISRPGYAPLVEQLGVDCAISPRLITTGEVLRFIKGGRLVSLFLLLNEKAEVIELFVQPRSKIAGRPLHKSGLPAGTIIGTIMRGNKVIIPQGNDIIKEKDRLVVFALGHNVGIIESMCGLGGNGREQVTNSTDSGSGSTW